jgi:hypothetical protein
MIRLTSTIESTLLGLIVAVGLLFLLNANDHDERLYPDATGSKFLEIRSALPVPDAPSSSEILKANTLSFHVPSGVCVEVSRELLVLYAICFEKDSIPRFDFDVPVQSCTLFLRLFRTLISPNAP